MAIKIYSSFVLMLVVILIFVKCKRLCDHDEYHCNNNNHDKNNNDCVEINRHCNGLKDCNNNSDKINNCSSCNLTYFGQVGRTYGLEIKKPQESQLPFLCYLNFTTFGGNYGDLIQISFETFSIGKFESFTIDGCPNGFIQIQENNRPNTNGKWCGSSWGYTVYYSETPTILLILNLLKYDGNFEFKINYKFLKLSEAHLRYGRNNNHNLTTIQTNKRIYRGKLQIHSYCDRLFENCIRRQCRIQSPNYPGIYQRNLTCNYRIREKNIPNDKHALIAIRQANFHYKERLSKFDNSDKILRIWDQCNMMQDFIEIYDGWNEKSTLLTHLCSGETIPEIISSGPELLIKFHTSPYGNPFHPLPLSYLPGFELEIEVFYVDKESPTYIENGKKCEFLITPTFNGNNNNNNNRSGIIESPLNSLPPNTTCHYYFHGQTNNEIIWLSFIKYYINNNPNTNNERLSVINKDECDVKLQIWDGNLRDYQKTIPLIGQFCKDDQPKLCDHTLLTNSTRKTRPCSLTESYLSTQQALTIVHTIRYGSVLSPVNFVLKYEFIDLSQEGEQYNHKNPCDRIFVINEATNHSEMKFGRFYSPKITFLYGRGGQEALTCSYRFEARQSGNYRLKLGFFSGNFGNKKCQTRYNHEIDRYVCEQQRIDDGFAVLKIYEYPWLNNNNNNIKIVRDCFCENFTETKQIFINTSNRVVVKFVVTNMKIYEDFNDYNFDGFYEFLPQIEDNCGNLKKNRHLHGSSGEISIYNNNNNNNTNYCQYQPWLIEPEDPLNDYLYLKIKGIKVRDSRLCPGRNRLLVYSVGNTEDVQIICPYYKSIDDFVELFSDGWTITGQQSKTKKFLQNQQTKSFIIEFLQKESGGFVVNWMEISKNPAVTLTSTMLMLNPPECPYSCPELGACISSDLWCDGLIHCPSGNDEQESNCRIYQNQFPIAYLNTTTLIITIILLILIILMIVVMIFWYWKRDQQKNVVVSVTEHTFLEFKSGLC